jgi:hypothetical protein
VGPQNIILVVHRGKMVDILKSTSKHTFVYSQTVADVLILIQNARATPSKIVSPLNASVEERRTAIKKLLGDETPHSESEGGDGEARTLPFRERKRLIHLFRYFEIHLAQDIKALQPSK